MLNSLLIHQRRNSGPGRYARVDVLQVSFQFIPFRHDGRQDELRLYHWVQCYKDANGQTRPADDGPYSFSKYNLKVGSYKYDDIEYETVIRNHLPESETGWNKVCTPQNLLQTPWYSHQECSNARRASEDFRRSQVWH